MTSWHSYPSIYNLGHRATADLLAGDVVVEEKVDGSQFSFGVFDGGLRVRSKNVELVLDDPRSVGMFAAGVATAQRLAAAGLLVDGWTYRGEYLAKPRHNGLAYARVPAGNVILFDVMPAEETYLAPEARAAEARRLGLECVPVVAGGRVDVSTVQACLARESVLGGQLVEGVVIKPAPGRLVFGRDKKTVLGKYVSPAFRETQKKTWRQDNPTAGDVVATLVDEYATPARWAKAVQHLRDAGSLDESPRDIGPIMAEVWADIVRDSADDIRDALFSHFQRQLRAGVTKGVPEWYKERLLTSALPETPADDSSGCPEDASGPLPPECVQASTKS
jgi:hypothetical protein